MRRLAVIATSSAADALAGADAIHAALEDAGAHVGTTYVAARHAGETVEPAAQWLAAQAGAAAHVTPEPYRDWEPRAVGDPRSTPDPRSWPRCS